MIFCNLREPSRRRSALEKAAADSFYLIMLDVMLPGTDGFEVCRELRQRPAGCPDSDADRAQLGVDKVVGLKVGADDYLTKPFDFAELLVRMEALPRRSRAETGK